jgi:hypothetical protein
MNEPVTLCSGGGYAVRTWVLFVYILATEHSTEQQTLFGVAFVVGLALNLVYLIRCPPGIPKSPSRLRKLFSLWLDAKEPELRDRIGKQ